MGDRYEVKVERDLVVTAPDGVALMTDVYHPIGVERGPVIVERSGYGRMLMASLGLAFTATLAGGSRADCESWFIVLEPLQKTTH